MTYVAPSLALVVGRWIRLACHSMPHLPPCWEISFFFISVEPDIILAWSCGPSLVTRFISCCDCQDGCRAREWAWSDYLAAHSWIVQGRLCRSSLLIFPQLTALDEAVI